MVYSKAVLAVRVQDPQGQIFDSRVRVAVKDDTTVSDLKAKVNASISSNPAFQQQKDGHTQHLTASHIKAGEDYLDDDLLIKDGIEDDDTVVACTVPAQPPSPPAPAPAPAAAAAAEVGSAEDGQGGVKRPLEVAQQQEGADGVLDEEDESLVEPRPKQPKANVDDEADQATAEEEQEEEHGDTVSIRYATLDGVSSVQTSRTASVESLKAQILEQERPAPAAAAAASDPSAPTKPPVHVTRNNVCELGPPGDCVWPCKFTEGKKIACRPNSCDLLARSEEDADDFDERFCAFCREPLQGLCLARSREAQPHTAGDPDLTLATVGGEDAPGDGHFAVEDSCPLIKNVGCSHVFHWHCLCNHFQHTLPLTGYRTCPTCQLGWRFTTPTVPETSTSTSSSSSSSSSSNSSNLAYELEVFAPSAALCGVGRSDADWQRVTVRLDSGTGRRKLASDLADALGFDASQWGLRVLQVGTLTIPLGQLPGLYSSYDPVGLKIREKANISVQMLREAASSRPLRVTGFLCSARRHAFKLAVQLQLRLPAGVRVTNRANGLGNGTNRMEIVISSEHRLDTLVHKVNRGTGILAQQVRLSWPETDEHPPMKLQDTKGLTVLDLLAMQMARNDVDGGTKLELDVTQADIEEVRFIVDIWSAYHRMPYGSGRWTVQQLIQHTNLVPPPSPSVDIYVNLRPTLELERPPASVTAAAAAGGGGGGGEDECGDENDTVAEEESGGGPSSPPDEEGEVGGGPADRIFAASSDWSWPVSDQSVVKVQTDKGVSTLLSCLYVLSERADNDTINRLTGHLRAVVGFPPAVYAMRLILMAKHHAKQMTAADKALVARTLYKLLRDLAPIEQHPDEKLFESVRVVLLALIGRATTSDTATETYRSVPLTCCYLHTRIKQPIYVADEIHETQMTVRERLLKMASHGVREGNSPLFGTSSSASSSSSISVPSNHMAILLHSYPTHCLDALCWVPPDTEADEDDLLDAAETGGSMRFPWHMLVADARHMRACRLLQLVRPERLAAGVLPLLTIDAQLNTAVYRGQEPCGSDSVMYLPLTGSEQVFDAQRLASQVSSFMESQETAGEMEEQDVNEAIVVCLDTSQSMGTKTAFRVDSYDQAFWRAKEEIRNGWDHRDPEDDSPSALQAALDNFRDYPCIKQMRACVLPLRDRHGISREQAGQLIIYELCKLNRLDGDCDEETTKLYTKYSERFVEVLLERVPTDPGQPPVLVDRNNPPDEYLCPITHEVMEHPIKASDGITYDREAIQRSGETVINHRS
ncbi:unnamed protein product [Vitrella brassicaformis CCMP3155]|uniref:U-box domain-containing protein n=1 Tax=Vitrella brassicaformis (strain CCMP3155) TaxID=1169540 RepID=A0A0G4EQX7_VITBC|nr:unnamed protein product [Vitrella brassicaformis CCMP3155]|eukprot:CEM00648.1 unnamed protein product [Vitrella brassicaformis CCMP3155]